MKKYKFYLIALALLTIGLTFQMQTTRTSQTVYAACPANDYTVHCNIIVTKYIAPGINFLSVGVGVIVLAMIIIGAIQYSGSGGNPQTLGAAKKKIYNALLALILFALMYAFLNFIIPGGIVPI